MSKYYKAEDVINAIEDKIAEYIPTLYGRYGEIPLELRMAIENLPIIEVSEDELKGCDKVDKRFSEDAISREYILERANEWFSMYPDSDTAREAITMLLNEIDNAPSVIPKPKEGEWIRYMGDIWTCTACGESLMCDDIECNNYCPNCGSKMKGASR